MAIQTRYITADEFTEYFGINLAEELKDTANASDKVNAFIARTEDRLEAYLNATFFKLVSDCWPVFTDNQKLWYKKALLEQCYYTFKNGDISADSGYESDKGIIANPEQLKKLVIAPNAKHYLKLTGLWSGHIGTGGFFGPWVV